MTRADVVRAAEEALARGDRWAAVLAVAPLALRGLRKKVPARLHEDAEQTFYLTAYQLFSGYKAGKGTDPLGFAFLYVVPRTCALLYRTSGPASGGTEAARKGYLRAAPLTLDAEEAVVLQPVTDPWPRTEDHIDAELVLSKGNLTPKQRAAMLAWDQGAESRLVSAHRAMGLGKLRAWVAR